MRDNVCGILTSADFLFSLYCHLFNQSTLKKLKSVVIFWFCFCSITSAQTDDDHIIISNKTDIYSYELNNQKTIHIREKSDAEYTCIGKIESVTIAKFFDHESKIEKVKIKGIKASSPRYEMYRQKEIFYSDTKVCYFELPFSRKDEVAQVSFEKAYENIYSFFAVLIAEPQFIKKKTVKLIVPDWLTVDLIELNFRNNIRKSIEKNTKDNTTIYTYNIEDQDKITEEPNMPGYSYIYPYILVVPKKSVIDNKETAYFDSFDHLYKWYRNINSLLNNDEDIIREKAKEITQGYESEEDKIKALLSWVQNNIRYLAFEYGIDGFKPDEAHEVLRKKYGDCKGMSNLLKSLLKAEGFDARLVWVGTKEAAFDLSVPLPLADHMICVLQWKGKRYYLDPTVRFMTLGEYPQWIQGKTALIENGPDYMMEQIPDSSPLMNTDSLFSAFTIDENVLTGKSLNVYKGESKQLIMSAIQATKMNEQHDALKQFLLRGRIHDKIENIQISEANSPIDKIEISYHETRKSDIKSIDDELYINLNICQDFVNTKIDTSKRRNDYLLPYKDHIVRESHLIIPSEYEVASLPVKFRIDKKNYSFLISYAINNEKIMYHKEIIIFDPWIKKRNFAEWNSDIDALKKAYLEQIILKKKQ
jgi:transglutaminase-like putative cysteine protease